MAGPGAPLGPYPHGAFGRRQTLTVDVRPPSRGRGQGDGGIYCLTVVESPAESGTVVALVRYVDGVHH